MSQRITSMTHAGELCVPPHEGRLRIGCRGSGSWPNHKRRTGTTIQAATQAHLEQFLTTTPGYDHTAAITGFVAWPSRV